MSRNKNACESCTDQRDVRPELRVLGIVVAVAVGIAAYGAASLVFAGASVADSTTNAPAAAVSATATAEQCALEALALKLAQYPQVKQEGMEAGK
jgi:hypothetical protein